MLMIGLDAAGKTTILHAMKASDDVSTIPTIGFSVETLAFSRGSRLVSLTALDVGGQDKIRLLWRQYYSQTSAVVFVVDSCDRERADDAAGELAEILSDVELQGAPLLVFANKQDLPGAMPPAEVVEKLGLHSIRGRKWMIQPCCATKCEGVLEGFDWLTWQLEGGRAEAPAHADGGRIAFRARPELARTAASEADTESTVDPGDAAAAFREAPIG